MNQTFYLTRFGRLLRKYLTDNQGQLLIYIALLISGLAVLTVFVYQGFPDEVDQNREILFFC